MSKNFRFKDVKHKAVHFLPSQATHNNNYSQEDWVRAQREANAQPKIPPRFQRARLDTAFSDSSTDRALGQHILRDMTSGMEAMKDKLFILDIAHKGVTDEMFNEFNDENITNRISHMLVNGNRLSDRSFNTIVKVLIDGTIETNKIPRLDILDDEPAEHSYRPRQREQLSRPTLDALRKVQKQLKKYVRYNKLLKVLKISTIVLISLLVAGIILFNAACLAVAAMIHAPILAFLAALTTFVGGSMGMTLIGMAAIGCVLICSVPFYSLLDIGKNHALAKANEKRIAHKEFLASEEANELRAENDHAPRAPRREHRASLNRNTSREYLSGYDESEDGVEHDEHLDTASSALNPTR